MRIQTLAAIGALLGLSACAPTTPTFDREFGNAVRALNAQQLRHPDAPMAHRERLPDGLDGRSASTAVGNYHRSSSSSDQVPSSTSSGSVTTSSTFR
jgi:hypothetical protein